MASIRQSNRVLKSRDYWNFTNSLSHQKQSSAFIIYTESSEDLDFELSDENLDFELSDENLDFELSDKDLDSELSDEDLDSELFKKDLSSELDEDLSLKLDEDLSEYLSRQLHEDLDVDSLYQLQFLFKNRVDKSQNFFEDSDSLKLFQLFFSVKKIKNIVKELVIQSCVMTNLLPD